LTAAAAPECSSEGIESSRPDAGSSEGASDAKSSVLSSVVPAPDVKEAFSGGIACCSHRCVIVVTEPSRRRWMIANGGSTSSLSVPEDSMAGFASAESRCNETEDTLSSESLAGSNEVSGVSKTYELSDSGSGADTVSTTGLGLGAASEAWVKCDTAGESPVGGEGRAEEDTEGPGVGFESAMGLKRGMRSTKCAGCSELMR
jgi:hypothetical protein